MDPSGIEMLCRPERPCTVADQIIYIYIYIYIYRRWTTWSSLGLGLLAVAMIVISGTVCIPQMVKASFPTTSHVKEKNHVATMPASSQMYFFFDGSSQNKICSKVFCSRWSGRYQVLLSCRKLWNQETRQTKLAGCLKDLKAFSEVPCRNMIQFGQEDVPTG